MWSRCTSRLLSLLLAATVVVAAYETLGDERIAEISELIATLPPS